MEVVDAQVPHVYCRLYRLNCDDEQLAHYQSLLSDDELEKSQRYYQAALKRRYILTRAYTRIFLSDMTGLSAPSLVFKRSEFGKPYLTNAMVDFSISHSLEYLLIAISEKGRVGCDVECSENFAQHDQVSLLSRIASNREIDHFSSLCDEEKIRFSQHIWVYKEAWLKAQGLGFMADPKEHCTLSLSQSQSDFHLDSLQSTTVQPSLTMALCHIL